MVTESVWERTIDLTNRVFQVTSGLNLLHGDQWPGVVTVFLTQGNERLDSTRALLDNNHSDSAVILTRSLFELAVNLAYIAKNTAKRLREYLKHGGIPTTSQEAQQLQQDIDSGAPPAVIDIVPRQAWRRLKDMCCELGSGWLKEYGTFYRYASVPTHAGSFTLGNNYVQLLKQQPPSDRQKAVVLVSALAFHLRVAEISANVFPQEIKPEAVRELRTECEELGQTLARG